MRRLVILAEGHFSVQGAKTAVGVLRFSSDETVAVIDSEHAGADVATVLASPGLGEGIPVVASITDALPFHPTSLLIGIAPIGGRLPDVWRPTIVRALEEGLEVISGLHIFLGEDHELRAAAERGGGRIWDVRQPPAAVAMHIGEGRPHRPGSHTIYFAGTDCNVGKMTAALVIERGARDRGWDAAFAATGQTGIMIAGAGVPVDRLISDFTSGGVEAMVSELAEQHAWVFVEGQGSLGHPAYAPVTLGLVHGAAPDAFILCHEAGREFVHGFPEFRIASLPTVMSMYTSAASWLGRTTPFVGVALNTYGMPDDAARAAIAETATSLGLPTTDPVRYGADVLLDALSDALI